jgi:hypothetical protein
MYCKFTIEQSLLQPLPFFFYETRPHKDNEQSSCSSESLSSENKIDSSQLSLQRLSQRQSSSPLIWWSRRWWSRTHHGVLPNNERDYDRSFESSLRTTWTKLSIREIETICRAGVRQYHDTKEQWTPPARLTTKLISSSSQMRFNRRQTTKNQPIEIERDLPRINSSCPGRTKLNVHSWFKRCWRTEPIIQQKQGAQQRGVQIQFIDSWHDIKPQLTKVKDKNEKSKKEFPPQDQTITHWEMTKN